MSEVQLGKVLGEPTIQEPLSERSMWSYLGIQLPSHWLEATCGKFDLLQGQGSVFKASGPLIAPCGCNSGRCTLIPTTSGSNLTLWRMRGHGRFENNLCYKMIILVAVEEMGRNGSIIKVKKDVVGRNLGGDSGKKMFD